MRADHVEERLATASRFVAGSCLFLTVGAGALQVVCRYGFDAPLLWPEEVSRLLFVWMTYVGALVLPESGMHVAVGVLFDRLPRSGRRAADVLANGLAIVFFGALLVGGISLVRALSGILLPALQVPLSLLVGVVPVAAALQVYLHVGALLRCFGAGSLRRYSSGGESGWR